jgi:hypothetical protein
MTLYVKTGSAVLQTINLTGYSVASIMELELVQKVVAVQQTNQFSLKDYVRTEFISNGTVPCAYF